jgi:transporter family-2 protein
VAGDNRTSVPARHSLATVSIALLACFIAGGVVSAQSRITGGLAHMLNNAYVPAVLSFGVGLIVLTPMVFLSQRSRAGLFSLLREVRARRFPWWALTGGFFGAYFVLTQGLAAGVLGIAIFTVGIVAGQVLGGLVMDQIGFGPSGRIPLTVPRVLGTALAIAAVVVEAWGAADLGPAMVLIVLPLSAGVGMSGQAAMNGLVRSAARSTVTATFMNFLAGTALLAVIAAVSVAVSGWPTGWPTQPVYYVAGLIGCVFIAAQAMLVHTVGVLLFSMANVAGQLAGSVAIELGLPLGDGMTVGMVVGTILAFTAMAIATIPSTSKRVPGKSVPSSSKQ